MSSLLKAYTVAGGKIVREQNPRPQLIWPIYSLDDWNAALVQFYLPFVVLLQGMRSSSFSRQSELGPPFRSNIFSLIIWVQEPGIKGNAKQHETGHKKTK